MKKKVIYAIWVVSFIMPFCLISCGGDDSDTTDKKENNTPENTETDPNLLTIDLQMPGTLSSNIPNQKFTKLKVNGDINGSDIKYLRGIVSNILELDLSDANIVEGGDAYYKISYNTTKNVIGECMFAECTGNFKMILPKTVTRIDSYAYENCIGLKEITIHDNVKQIASYSFKGCLNLGHVNFSKSLTSIGEGAFSGCSDLKELILPSSIISIGQECFYECSKLKDIVMPDKLSTIGKRAFYGCKELSKIEIPGNVYSIDAYAFEGCSSLSEISIKGPIKTLSAGIFKGTKLYSYTIPESVEEIQSQAFLDCYELTKLIIGKNVKIIATGCATYCTNFKEFVVSEDNESYTSIDGVLFSKDKTKLVSYPHGKADSNYIVPSSVTTIGGRSFESTENLKSVSFPSSLERIEANAFLSSPTFNKKLVEIHAKSQNAPLVVYNGFGQYGFPHRENERIETAYVPIRCLNEYKSMWGSFFNQIYEEE